jgi:hypothetical protein
MKPKKINETSKRVSNQTTKVNSEWKRGESIFSTSDNPCMLSIQVPRTLNSWVLMETYPPSSVPNWSMDIICYMVHLIQREESLTSSPITRNSLFKFEIPDCNEYINYLLMTNVIEEIRQFCDEEEIISYKLTSRYNSPCVPQIIHDPRLLEAIKRYNDKQASLIENKYPYLMRWLKSNKLYIDSSKAEGYNEMSFAEGLVSSLFNDELSSYNSQKVIIEDIVNQNLNLEFDNESGSIHTLLNYLPMELEEYIRYDNKELVSIGVDNSSSKLCVLFLDKESIKNPIVKSSIAKYNPKFQESANFEKLVDFIALHQKNADVLEFKELAQDVFFFNRLTHKIDEQGLDIIPSTYQQLEFVSDAVHLTINAKNTLIPYIAETKFFTTAFPTVSLIFEKIKENKEDNNAHLVLAKTLRTLQVELYLNRICKRISEQNPNIPIFTKYDRVITTIEYEEFVAQIVNEEFGKVLGFNPRLSIEEWT